jgi:predicted O-methyltransferase YrrM
MEMTPERWRYTSDYLHGVFGAEDAILASIMPEAMKQGMPDIAVSPEVGRLLMILTSMTRGRMALEVGTLAGYSGIWIARGLRESGRLITVESEARHADFAQEQFRRAGLADRIDLRRSRALDVLPTLAREMGAGSVDVVFLDAVKTEYPEYWRLVRPLIAVGGLIIADNALGSNVWWIDSEGDESRDAADRFNREVAGDPDFEAAGIPLRQGLLVARRMR